MFIYIVWNINMNETCETLCVMFKILCNVKYFSLPYNNLLKQRKIAVDFVYLKML